MATLSLLDSIKIARRGIHNFITGHPITVSYEVTLSCNCNCRHCDLGGMRRDENQLKPVDYANLTRLFNPVMAQISGGEPLLREDIVEVARAIKQPDGMPCLIFVTNGTLLNEEIYLQLREAGVNQFSVSLDFPDQRHDEFRRRRGLYEHLERTVPQLARLGYQDIILNTVITKANLKEILPIARRAEEWGVFISYSVYTPRRTGSREYCIDTEEDLQLLRQTIDELIELTKRSNFITNPKSMLQDTLKFVEQGGIPNCKSGLKFFVVTPEGDLIPCSLHRDKKYSTHKEMIEKFYRTNQCGDCYVGIRSYSERSFWRWLKEAPTYANWLISRRKK
jgi:MoaA/NifB/PqqE/SkfB family radical SAM enzyme